MWRPIIWAQVLCVVLLNQVVSKPQGGFSEDDPINKIIDSALNNSDVIEAERTYVFGKHGEVHHQYVEDHRDPHKGKMEKLIQMWQTINSLREQAKESGEGSLDPHSELLEEYEKLKEELENESNGTIHDPEVDTSMNSTEAENTTMSSDELGRRKRIMSPGEWSRWTKGIVPYKINEDVMNNKDEYKRAMALIEEFTCIRFVEWTETINEELGLGHPGHLIFVASSNGCWSYVGNTKWSGGQQISCCTGYTCVHELGHALGLQHEHQSPQRDGWIRVNENNIGEGWHWTYSRFGDNDVMYFPHGYDLSSIMHYPTWGFSSGGPTMTLLFPELFLDENEYYFFNEVSTTHKCHESELCEGFTTKCENEGYVTVVKGECACRCPKGLDPKTGCTTSLTAPSVTMPKGQYALLKPKTGCPDESFQDGQVIHYGEGENYRSGDFSLMGEFSGAKAEHNFCTRDVDDAPESSEDDVFEAKSDWPAGTYCILRKGGECPIGFQTGYVQYDDVPQDGDNVNSNEGTLPDGVFGNDTRMEFCCQYNGFPKDPVFFPTHTPLALFAIGSQCQEILGMHSRFEYYGIDSVNGGSFNFEGIFRHWYNQPKEQLSLTYCFYTPADLDCGGEVVIDAANPEVWIMANSTGRPDMECTWVVKGPTENGTLVLDFEEFDVKSNGEICQDSVEVRHSRIGQRGLLYCGSDDKSSIRSIYDKMLIRFTTNGESTSNFKAVIKWVANADMCYDVTDGGSSYRGKVNYTRTFEPCLPWTEVAQCPHHPWQSGDELAGLDGNYCRNPDNSIRPWCYTETDGCKRNYCDVCKLESPFNRAEDCAEKRKNGFCTEDAAKAVHSCACKCKDLLPSTGPIKKYTELECSPPVTPSDGELVGESKEIYKLGEKVTFKCKQSISTVTTTCLHDGSWSTIGSRICTGCPQDSVESGDSCHILFAQRVTYVKAKEVCQEIDGLVAMAKSSEENEIIFSAGKGNQLWLGLTDEETEGTFVWEDGTPLNYTNWNGGEPNNWGGYEDCTVMKGDKLWNDMYCDVSWSTAATVCTIPKLVTDTCEDVLADSKCSELLVAKPTMCGEYTDFAEKFCAVTCGVCTTVAAITCDIEAPGLNVAVSNNKTSIKAGESIQYGCEGDTYKEGGSEVRACQPDGTLTGTPLICADIVGSVGKVGVAELTKQNLAVPETVAFTGENDLWRIQHDGVIVAWEFYSNSPEKTAFQVWRVAESKSKYRLIGQNVMTTGNDMEERYEVPAADRIRVEAGDLIGIWKAGPGGIHFKKCDGEEHPEWVGVSWSNKIASTSDFSVGNIHSFYSDIGCCEFTFRAEVAVSSL